MSSALPETIKAVRIEDNKTVKVVDIPFASNPRVQNLPENEVLVHVRAVGLNPTDWKHAIGDWGPNGGAIAGCDAAGDVVKVGSAVAHVKAGDRVWGFNHGNSFQKDNGAYSEYVRCAASATAKIPDTMSYAEAASFPIPHLTAVQALYMRLALPFPFSKDVPATPSEKILIWGGSTAVGHHAVQLATLSGLEVFVTASPSAHEELKKLGAKECFDYKDKDVVRKIKAAAGPQGIIYALDTVSEHGSTDFSIDAMSDTRDAKVITLLPTTDAQQSRRPNVSVHFTLAYLVLGAAVDFVGTHFDASPGDTAASLDYVSTTYGRVVEGWKEGQGAPQFKTQRLRKMEGGLEGIGKGFEIMRDGNYGREKLVYTI